jgi:glyoxylase-like metal-dependent hydrolase (beta-lactamase superfamily II)
VTAVYSHGHIDHSFGMPVWAAEAAERNCVLGADPGVAALPGGEEGLRVAGHPAELAWHAPPGDDQVAFRLATTPGGGR